MSLHGNYRPCGHTRTSCLRGFAAAAVLLSECAFAEASSKVAPRPRPVLGSAWHGEAHGKFDVLDGRPTLASGRLLLKKRSTQLESPAPTSAFLLKKQNGRPSQSNEAHVALADQGLVPVDARSQCGDVCYALMNEHTCCSPPRESTGTWLPHGRFATCSTVALISRREIAIPPQCVAGSKKDVYIDGPPGTGGLATINCKDRPCSTAKTELSGAALTEEGSIGLRALDTALRFGNHESYPKTEAMVVPYSAGQVGHRATKTNVSLNVTGDAWYYKVSQGDKNWLAEALSAEQSAEDKWLQSELKEQRDFWGPKDDAPPKADVISNQTKPFASAFVKEPPSYPTPPTLRHLRIPAAVTQPA